MMLQRQTPEPLVKAEDEDSYAGDDGSSSSRLCGLLFVLFSGVLLEAMH